MESSHYRRLVLMVVLSFIVMYVLMYAMVNSTQNVFMNFNQVYMAGLMAAPMALIELALMRSMYKHKRLNAVVVAVSVVALVLFWTLIRQQGAIGDKQFLRSMIPHHASAILMCEQAAIRDAEIKTLAFHASVSMAGTFSWCAAPYRAGALMQPRTGATERDCGPSSLALGGIPRPARHLRHAFVEG